MIENEITILNGLRHANINKLLGYGSAGKIQKISGREVNGLIYMLLEYTPKMFYDICDQHGPMGENAGRMFMKQILDAMKYLQRKGVAHRDLKLENILVDQGLNLKIADFGLAAYKHIETLNEYRGTKTYMAPEIRELKIYNGKKADIFSVGVILWIIINGNFPFVAAKDDDYYYRLIIENKLDEYWTAVNGKHLSDEFKEIFLRMVSKDPEQRPSVDELMECAWMKRSFNVELTKEIIIANTDWTKTSSESDKENDE